MRTRVGVVSLLLIVPVLSAAGQRVMPVPVRPLGPIVARTSDSLGEIGSVRPLSNGSVVVRDAGRKQILMFDSTLRHAIVVADTTSSTARAYGNPSGALIPFPGDTTLLFDIDPHAFVVIDPNGKIAKVIASPNTIFTQDWGYPGVDRDRHLIYRVDAARTPGRGATPPVTPDSAPILRFDFATRRVDTAGFLGVRVNRMAPYVGGRGTMSRVMLQPFYTVDDWVLMSDGSIAIIRGHDLHIDWIDPRGERTSSPKVPYDWVRLTDSLKVAMVDSIRRADSVTRLGYTPAMQQLYPSPWPVIPAEEIADYLPAFVAPGARADLDDNVWIRMTPLPGQQGGPIYDIVNRKGELIDRVQIPGGCTLSGVGAGMAYLISREGSGYVLARARIR